MEPQRGKFLIGLVQGLSHRSILFLFWGAMVGGFILLMFRHYEKMTRSQFRRDNPPKKRPLPPVPVSSSRDVTKKSS